MQTVTVPALGPELLLEELGEVRVRRLQQIGEIVQQAMGTHMQLHVNSTAAGGGVAEMLHTLLGYARGAELDIRWMTIDAPAEFYGFTKQLHHTLHGVDVGLDPEGGRELYEGVLRAQRDDLLASFQPGDIVILHDPQTAGLAEVLVEAGARVAWRCHVGTAHQNNNTERAWAFLRPYLKGIPIIVSQRAYLPDWADIAETFEIPPSIDPLSPKNMDLDPAFAREILQAAGLLSDGTAHMVTFTRRDGSPGRIEHAADVLQAGPPPPVDAQLIVQVSRWDPLKDMAGVMEAFARYVYPHNDSHLVLAGPNVSAVADDPEGAEVLQECMAAWGELPAAVRRRVHLACLPMLDADENALLVNALQRVASVVTQKSIEEGFGLTVAEAMLKARPVVATRVGGIPAQIVSGETGILIDDPHDLAAFGSAICGLLAEPAWAEELGRRGQQSVSEQFLPDRHLQQWAELILHLVGPAEST